MFTKIVLESEAKVIPEVSDVALEQDCERKLLEIEMISSSLTTLGDITTELSQTSALSPREVNLVKVGIQSAKRFITSDAVEVALESDVIEEVTLEGLKETVIKAAKALKERLLKLWNKFLQLIGAREKMLKKAYIDATMEARKSAKVRTNPKEMIVDLATLSNAESFRFGELYSVDSGDAPVGRTLNAVKAIHPLSDISSILADEDFKSEWIQGILEDYVKLLAMPAPGQYQVKMELAPVKLRKQKASDEQTMTIKAVKSVRKLRSALTLVEIEADKTSSMKLPDLSKLCDYIEGLDVDELKGRHAIADLGELMVKFSKDAELSGTGAYDVAQNRITATGQISSILAEAYMVANKRIGGITGHLTACKKLLETHYPKKEAK